MFQIGSMRVIMKAFVDWVLHRRKFNDNIIGCFYLAHIVTPSLNVHSFYDLYANLFRLDFHQGVNETNSSFKNAI